MNVRPYRPALIATASDHALWRPAIVLCGTAILALAAQVSVPLPFSPVPVTGQTLAVLLLGGALGARLGALTVAAYVVAGAAGLPVFAGGAAGAARLVGPTGGYLVGFIAAAAIVGWAAERGWTTRVTRTIAAMLLGEAAIYAFGLAWLARFPLPVSLFDAGLLPFVVGDIYKVGVAVALLHPATRAVQRARHTG